jgi:TonB family protein
MPTTESNLEISTGRIRTGSEQRQRRRMLIALGLLVLALGVLLFKDREFYFSSNQSDSEPVESSPTPDSAMAATAAPATTTTAPAATMTAPAATKPLTQAPPVSKPAAPPSVASKPKKAKSRMSHPVQAAPVHVAQAAPAHVAKAAPAQIAQAAPAEDTQDSAQASADGPVVTTTNRTILYPLEVEVQAGNQHRPVSTTNNSVKVDMQSTASAAFAGKTPAVEAQPGPPITESAEARVSLAPGTAERVTKSVKPDYPVLAKQMKVQGAVVLEALIDRIGNIQELHVLSGPSILATAAREAVRQWRFKPYYEHGEPVETEARITVNFTISTY